LLPAPARRRAGLLLIACAAVVAVLGAAFAHQTAADGFDRAVDAPFIDGLGGHYNLSLWLSAAGSQIPAIVVSAAIIIACLLTGRLNGALLGAATIPVSIGLDEHLLKPLFDRTYLGSLSYPSGHTTSVFALAATLTVLLLIQRRPGRARALSVSVPAVACLAGIVVATGVIALKWHYFTDTVAGAAVGIGSICGLALILDLPPVRRLLAWVCRQPADATCDPEISPNGSPPTADDQVTSGTQQSTGS
jgi:membrane-associated phospholipid phosphatase